MDLDAGESPWGDVPSSSGPSKAVEESPKPQASATSSPANPPTAVSPPPVSTSALSKSVTGRSHRRVGGQATQVETLDGGLDPLSALGDSTLSPLGEQPPAPPLKEQLAVRNGRSATPTSQRGASMLESVDLTDDVVSTGKARMPPPVQPSQTLDGIRRGGQPPSVSVEQAAKPDFHITVGDPHKVGDLTSSHTVYQVQTRTTSKAYRTPEFTVSRRYRDFLWLYNTLHNNNPGVIIPPPPEKQAVGRFDADFVESRRQALERMLNKITMHPILQHDGDLKIFLESDTFNMDVKHKENKEPDIGQNKGMFSSIGFGVGTGGKFVEHDDWFHDRRIYLDALENQLKNLLKSIDTVVVQRKSLAEACGDFSASLHALSTVELSPVLSGPLEGLSELQIRIKELYERQAQQDLLTIGITIDEYIRVISSIKTSFSQRQKSYHSWHAAETELQKRKVLQEKLLRQGKSQQDRLNQLNADVADAERKVNQARLLFEDMGRLMRNELERFEREKVEDFKSGVETFLESAVEAQKELIELWETFLMRFDADEETQPIYPVQESLPRPASATSPAKPASAEGVASASASGPAVASQSVNVAAEE